MLQELSLGVVQLVEELYRPDSFWHRSSHKKIGALAAIAGQGEIAAIPEIAPMLAESSPEIVRAAASAIETLLDCASVDEYPALDIAVRKVSGYRGLRCPRWVRSGPELLRSLERLGITSPAVLGIVSFHSSGYLRELAIQLLARQTSSEELSFLLLRVNDWVAPVREAAQRAVRGRFVANYAPAFVQSFRLVTRLQGARRSDHAGIISEIEMFLRAAGCDALQAGIASPDRDTKRTCYRLLLQASGSTQQAVLAAALTESDPMIRLLAVSQIRGLSDARLRKESLRLGQKDRFAPVRKRAFETAIELKEASDTWLRNALLDSHPSVRGLAQFHVAQAGLDLRDFYRRTIQAKGEELYSALSGLGEVGIARDAEIALPFTDSATVKIRRAAVRVIARLSPSEHLDLLERSLADRSGGVSREAASGLVKTLPLVAGTRLWHIFLTATDEHVQRHCLFLIARLSKWDSLGYLLQAFSKATTMRERVSWYIDRWLSRFNCSFSSANSEQMERISAALKSSDNEDLLKRFEFVLKGQAS